MDMLEHALIIQLFNRIVNKQKKNLFNLPSTVYSLPQF